jgi:hypothetical protein
MMTDPPSTKAASTFRARLGEIRYDLRDKLWLVPLVLAITGLVLTVFLVPVSATNSTPDKMTAAFVALLAASGALVVVIFGFSRKQIRRAKVGFAYLYLVLATISSLIGVLPALTDNAYHHRWGAPLLLGLSVAGVVGVFFTLLVAWSGGNEEQGS